MHSSHIYALLAILFWSTAASAFKLSLRYINPVLLQAIAVPSATVFLLGVLAARRQLRILFAQPAYALFYSGVMGFLNPFLYYQVLFRAYDRLPAQEAAILNYVWPLTLVLLSIPILGQRISPISIISLVTSFLGVLIIGTRGHPASLEFRDPVGVSLALGSSVVWSIFWLANVRDTRTPIIKLATAFLFCSCYTTVVCLIHLHGGGIPFRGSVIRGVAGAIYIGLAEMGIAYIFWLKALSTARSTAHVGNLIFLSPFLSLLWIRIFVGETLFPSTAAGFLCILLGIILQQRSRSSDLPR